MAGNCGLTIRPGGMTKSTASKAPVFIGIVGSEAARIACIETARAVASGVLIGPAVWGSLPLKSIVSRSPDFSALT